jgi:pyridoxal phosphate enzyme (YggS family)
MSIADQLVRIKSKLPEAVTLVAVSKTKPNTDILEAYSEGQRVFGENKVQELVKKQEELPKDIQWHMIGHLQRNKVKFIAPFVALIHGVDNHKLLQEIDKRAAQNNRKIDCLLQVHIAKEDTKFGFEINEVREVLLATSSFKNISIVGLMGMATFTDDTNQIQEEFKSLKTVFDSIKNDTITILSMGMSGDYPLALEQGSTMVRVGSAIFGHRK